MAGTTSGKLTDLFSRAHQATRKGQFLRLGLHGASGSGKTMTALMVADILKGDGGVLVIDTEAGSAELYSDNREFISLPWGDLDYDVELLDAALAETIPNLTQEDLDNMWGGPCPFSKISVVIIDSFSHFWSGTGGILARVAKEAMRFKGDNRRGWAIATPLQDHLVQETIMNAPYHIILCMRAKTAFAVGQDNGKNKAERHALNPIQRDTTVYELTVSGAIQSDHSMIIEKTRCDSLDTVYGPNSGTERFAEALVKWLNTDEAESAILAQEQELKEINAKRAADEKAGRVEAVDVSELSEADQAEIAQIKEALNGRIQTLSGMFNQIVDGKDRAAAKTTFVNKMGKPSDLTEENIGEAEQLVKELTGQA